jgi:hypothetical protein
MGFILDIDAFRTTEFAPGLAEIGETFEALRGFQEPDLLRADHRGERGAARIMQVVRRPETAQGRTGCWESGDSGQTATAETQLDQAAREIRGERYRSLHFALLDLFAEARAEQHGQSVDVRAFAPAGDLLDALPHGLPVPEVAVDPDGEIAIDWIRPDRTMVSLSVGSTGDPSYAAILRDRTVHGVIGISEGFPSAVTELLRRLYHPA